MTAKCVACKDGVDKPMEFSMAFQPIVDVQARSVYAYEALVRGPQGEPACTVLEQVTPENLYTFDQSCRTEAIQLASRLRLEHTGASLAINFLPGAVYSPAACIQHTLRTARLMDFPLDRLIFEVTESERVVNPKHLQSIAEEYCRHGFRMAIDDFGAGFANLNLLATLSASVLKLDMALTRDLQDRPNAQIIVRSMVALCSSLHMDLVAEGVETAAEFRAMQQCGVHLMQGYLFARPAFRDLPVVNWPEGDGVAAVTTRVQRVPRTVLPIIAPA